MTLVVRARRRGRVLVGVGIAVVAGLALVVVGHATAGPVAPAPTVIAAPVGAGPAGNPVVVLGASISAGTGSTPEQAWPAVVGRCLGRRVVVAVAVAVMLIGGPPGRREGLRGRLPRKACAG